MRGSAIERRRDGTGEVVAATRYWFDEVRAALHGHWGLSLHRGGEMGDGTHDGRWDAAYSKTGYVVGGDMGRGGLAYQRFATLADIVRVFELTGPIEQSRRALISPRSA